MKTSTAQSYRTGVFANGIAYAVEGSGPPLILFRGVLPSPENPTGVTRWAERRSIQQLTRTHTIYTVSRKPSLSPQATMTEVANDYAEALSQAFPGQTFDIMGWSTAGSIALQFAVDHPGMVKRLAVAATAHQLSERGRQIQQRYAEGLAGGNYRQAYQALAPGLATTPMGVRLFSALLWLSAPSRIADTQGMIGLLHAEDGMHLRDRLSQITAPTLIIGGEQDILYTPDLVRETAAGIPGAQCLIYPRHGHREILASKHVLRETEAFLQ